MALHVRGVVLPDDEVRDLYLVGDRVTFDPVPDAETIASEGFVLPGLVDAHCHLGIARGAGASTSLGTTLTLARPARWPAPTGTPGS
jgi:imidazolonepropionase-like amidohydrolase